jgi:hypothetical protein
MNTPRESIKFIHEGKFITKHLHENSKLNTPRESIEFIHEEKFQTNTLRKFVILCHTLQDIKTTSIYQR